VDEGFCMNERVGVGEDGKAEGGRVNVGELEPTRQ